MRPAQACSYRVAVFRHGAETPYGRRIRGGLTLFLFLPVSSAGVELNGMMGEARESWPAG